MEASLQDLRIQKTKNTLYRTYEKILKNHPRKTKKLMVTVFCKNSKISTITFYHHYHNFKDFLEEYMNSELFKYFFFKVSDIKKIYSKTIWVLFERIIDYFFLKFDIFQDGFKNMSKTSLTSQFVNVYLSVLNDYIYLTIKTLFEIKSKDISQKISLKFISNMLSYGLNYYLFMVTNNSDKKIDKNKVLINCRTTFRKLFSFKF